MATGDDLTDVWAELRRLRRRVRELESQSPLSNSSITSGSGVAVRMPSGISHTGDGSSTAGAAFLRANGGGQVGSGTAYFRSDGALTDSSGLLNFGVNVRGAASGTFAAFVRGELGVEAPLVPGGGLVSLGPAVKSASDAASSAASAASGAQSTANAADTKAGNAQTVATNALNRGNAAMSKANEIIDALTDLEQFVRSQHPSKPLYPPPVKG